MKDTPGTEVPEVFSFYKFGIILMPMKTLIAFSLLMELSFFLVRDLARNHDRRSARLFIRLAAGTAGTVMVLLELLLGRPCQIISLNSDILIAAGILAMYPCSFEKPSLSLKTAVLSSCAGIVLLLVFRFIPPGHNSFRAQRAVITLVVAVAVFIFHYVASAIRRFKGFRLFFRNAAVWYGVEEYSRFLYALAYLCLGMMPLCAYLVPGDAGQVLEAVCSFAFMALYAVLYLKAETGRTFILGEGAEMRIKDIIKGNLRTSFIDKAEEDRKMNNLYRKIMLYMSEEKPYLDPSFCMNDLAGKVYSNKLYLSRTINILSGRNFRQFVNYHRIQYAIALFKKDPKLKIGEVWEMSGFNSGVSFNMAFKVNTGKTPAEWLQDRVFEQNDRL